MWELIKRGLYSPLFSPLVMIWVGGSMVPDLARHHYPILRVLAAGIFLLLLVALAVFRNNRRAVDVIGQCAGWMMLSLIIFLMFVS